MMTKRSLQKAPVKKELVNPLVTEFQQVCKIQGYQDQEIINKINIMIQHYEHELHFVNMNLTVQLCRVISRLILKHTKLQQIYIYACVIQDPSFTQNLANDFAKNTANCLSIDFAPISREQILPLLTAQTLDVLSLRGVQTLTSYDYKTHEHRPFPYTLNVFFNSLCTSSIKVLNLYDCHIGDIGAIAMSTALLFNTNLQCLSLARNRIGDKGAIALSAALSSYQLSEKEAIIVDMLIADENKQKISDEGSNLMLKKKKGQKPPPKKPPPKAKKGQSKRFQELMNFDPESPSISPVVTEKWKNCEIGPNGQKNIPGNKTLNTLLLDENEIKKDGIEALKKMLKENKYLVNFSVAKNLGNEEEVLLSLSRNRV